METHSKPITNHSQQGKKGEGVPLHNSLEPRSETGEDKKTVMPVDADNHLADTHNRQDDSGGANIATKEDTVLSTFPADTNKTKEKRK